MISIVPILITFEQKHSMLCKEEVRDKVKAGSDSGVHEKIHEFLNVKWKERSRHESCEWIHQTLDTMHEMNRYRSLTLEASSEEPLDERIGPGLFFNASIDAKSPRLRLILHQPEKAVDRRIFREFGSHRFLHLNVFTDVDKRAVEHLLKKPFWLAGRRFSFLWCKATKSPQCFVLFAEEGTGIHKSILADKVRDWCVPHKFNQEITLGKQDKRMKLSFSRTTPSGKLPAQCLEIIPDIINKDEKGNDGDVMTDGCGLISGKMLDLIWKEYTRSQSSECEDCKECPFTSVQARIGPFKGVWVLDESLKDGIQCRKSQQKYNLPMQSLKNNDWEDGTEFFDAYDTVEVCSWDEKPEEGFLNIRLVQLLEERGVPFTLFQSYVDNGLKWIENLRAHPEGLFDHLKKRQAAIIKQNPDEECHDTQLLFRMEGVNCNKNEPVYSQKLSAFIRREADRMKRKVSICVAIGLDTCPFSRSQVFIIV